MAAARVRSESFWMRPLTRLRGRARGGEQRAFPGKRGGRAAASRPHAHRAPAGAVGLAFFCLRHRARAGGRNGGGGEGGEMSAHRKSLALRRSNRHSAPQKTPEKKSPHRPPAPVPAPLPHPPHSPPLNPRQKSLRVLRPRSQLLPRPGGDALPRRPRRVRLPHGLLRRTRRRSRARVSLALTSMPDARACPQRRRRAPAPRAAWPGTRARACARVQKCARGAKRKRRAAGWAGGRAGSSAEAGSSGRRGRAPQPGRTSMSAAWMPTSAERRASRPSPTGT